MKILYNKITFVIIVLLFMMSSLSFAVENSSVGGVNIAIPDIPEFTTHASQEDPKRRYAQDKMPGFRVLAFYFPILRASGKPERVTITVSVTNDEKTMVTREVFRKNVESSKADIAAIEKNFNGKSLDNGKKSGTGETAQAVNSIMAKVTHSNDSIFRWVQTGEYQMRAENGDIRTQPTISCSALVLIKDRMLVVTAIGRYTNGKDVEYGQEMMDKYLKALFSVN